MPTPGEKNATAEGTRPARRRAPLRPWLRALHRDAGYFVVGFTIIYAVSGLAVNHIGQWDPNFRQVQRVHRVALPQGADDAALTAAVLTALKITEAPDESFRESAGALTIQLKERTLHVDTRTGTVNEEGQSPRFFLRVANYLHL